ncbi:MAG: helix-turn-helix domain-containing protein [Prevotella sp.]|jgi:predicted transcriptional regulator|nr:helix-turn-helix domain-containing protein [Prevotella sp.]
MITTEKEKIIKAAIVIIEKLINSGYSNYKIAKETNITERTIGNYVNKDTKPSFANAKIILQHYGESYVQKTGNITNSGTQSGNTLINSKGHILNVSDPNVKKIMEGDKIELIRESYADELHLQEVNRLKTEIEGLKSMLNGKDDVIQAKNDIIKAKDELLADKNRTIDDLRKQIDSLSGK